ncbi:hypothetical protein CCB80_07740 [Armatimonadetes bacterium Uphvl-Ar1]|nr:hypothetical protein CCB80_07740 [Armatimonadetes bacterium Uphvl-Ar1]
MKNFLLAIFLSLLASAITGFCVLPDEDLSSFFHVYNLPFPDLLKLLFAFAIVAAPFALIRLDSIQILVLQSIGFLAPLPLYSLYYPTWFYGGNVDKSPPFVDTNAIQFGLIFLLPAILLQLMILQLRNSNQIIQENRLPFPEEDYKLLPNPIPWFLATCSSQLFLSAYSFGYLFSEIGNERTNFGWFLVDPEFSLARFILVLVLLVPALLLPIKTIRHLPFAFLFIVISDLLLQVIIPQFAIESRHPNNSPDTLNFFSSFLTAIPVVLFIFLVRGIIQTYTNPPSQVPSPDA